MLKPGDKAPPLELPLTIQARFNLADQNPKAFTMLVFYRGSHCPICRKYLEELADKLWDFSDEGVNAFTVSMDDQERACKIDADWNTRDVPLAYDLTEDQARQWDLFISSKREGSNEPDRFSEPAIYLINPDGTVYYKQLQSAPFARAPLDQILEAVRFIKSNDYPARGTAT